MPGTPDRPVVAVCGLGLLGLPMARRWHERGVPTVVWNRSPAAATTAANWGADVVATPARAAARADLVVTVLATGEALEAVLFGPDGIAAAPPAALAQAGTVGIDQVAGLAARLPAGWELLDAPVLGSVPQAERGELRWLVGAAEPVYARWAPVLAVLGEPVHTGPVPSGSALKHVLNAANAPMVALLAEAMALGERLGLDRELLLDELAGSRIGPLVRRKRAMIAAGDYPADSRLALHAKDLRLAAEAGAATGLPMSVLAAARALAEDAIAAGHGEADYAAVVGHLLDRPCG